jgi:solute:Na+ symporter, SSS family
MDIFIPLLFGLQFIYWMIGRRASKKLSGQDDYFLAGKKVKFFPLMMTFLATQIGGGIVLGAAEEAYQFGWPVLLYPFGAALGLILLGSGVGRKLAQFPVFTVAQIFEVVYNSPLLKRIASALSIISLFMILVAQVLASKKFLISMGCDYPPLFIAFWAIVIIYTAQGGLRAVISTDLVQALFFSIVFLGSVAFLIYTDPTTFSIPWKMGPTHWSPLSSKLCGWLLMPLLFMVIEQDMGQRCFAGASGKIVSRASLGAGMITLVICLVPLFFGILAKALSLNIPHQGSVLMTAIEQTTSPWITAFVGCGVLAAIISTATSLINAISSNLANDFNVFSKTVKMTQLMTACMALSAIFFAFYFHNVVDLLIQSYELCVSCLFIPICMALFKKKGSAVAAALAIAFGCVGFILSRLYPFPLKEVVSLFLSALGFWLGTAYSTHLTQKNKNTIFY